VMVVLLNACWSATKRGVSLCDFLTREQVADAAIGHATPVADESAIEFARQFYSPITQGKTVREACQRAANSLAELGKFGAAEVKLVGNGESVLTAGLPSGSRPCVIESGLPKSPRLPQPARWRRGEPPLHPSRRCRWSSAFRPFGINTIGARAWRSLRSRFWSSNYRKGQARLPRDMRNSSSIGAVNKMTAWRLRKERLSARLARC
jgi:hypothetical protein